MSSTTIARSEIAGAEALPLLGLVNFQEGSVASPVDSQTGKRKRDNLCV